MCGQKRRFRWEYVDMGQKGKGNIQNIEDIREGTVPDRNFAAGNMEEDVNRRAGADMVIPVSYTPLALPTLLSFGGIACVDVCVS